MFKSILNACVVNCVVGAVKAQRYVSEVSVTGVENVKVVGNIVKASHMDAKINALPRLEELVEINSALNSSIEVKEEMFNKEVARIKGTKVKEIGENVSIMDQIAKKLAK